MGSVMRFRVRFTHPDVVFPPLEHSHTFTSGLVHVTDALRELHVKA